MKKRIVALSAVTMALLLTACGDDMQGVELVNQTGVVADYSEYISIGQYKDLEVEAPTATFTDADLNTKISEAIDVYNYLYVPESINYVYELNDEVASKLSAGEYKNADSYKKFLKVKFEEEAKETQKEVFLNNIWDSILENSTFSNMDEDELKDSAEKYYNVQKANYEYYATYYSYSYEHYLDEILNTTDEQLKSDCYDIVRREKERIIASSVIFNEQKMAMDDKTFSKGVAKLASKYGYDSSSEFVGLFGEDYIREVLVAEKVDEFLIKSNKMIEK